jgi:hypothetical protein
VRFSPLAFLHVPMPTALKPSFPPLPGSLSSRNNPNKYMVSLLLVSFFWLKNCGASRKGEERVLENNRNGTPDHASTSMTRGGNN